MPDRRLPTLLLAAALACASPHEARASDSAPAGVTADAGMPRVRTVANRQSLFFVFPRQSATHLGVRPVDSIFKMLRTGFGQREAGCSRQLQHGWTIDLSDPIRQSAGVYTMRVSGWRECLFLPAQGNENFVDWELRLEFHRVTDNGRPALALRVTVMSVRGAHYTNNNRPRPPETRFNEAEAQRVEEGLNDMTRWMAKTLKAETDTLPQFFAENYGAPT